jgi:signal-transduction protein with cAMP-binding, CBS, and nucleotidyltransferase domain
MSPRKNLVIPTVASINKIKRPAAAKLIDIDSSAYEIFTDFSHQQPMMLERTTPIDDALAMMKREHVKLKLVISVDETFEGVITLADLHSVKVMRATRATGLNRKDLTVAHVMTTKDHLHAIAISEFGRATVGAVLSTMKQYGEQHVLVVDTQEKCICGIVSANDIARRLQVPVYISERANSFADIYKIIHH